MATIKEKRLYAFGLWQKQHGVDDSTSHGIIRYYFQTPKSQTKHAIDKRHDYANTEKALLYVKHKLKDPTVQENKYLYQFFNIVYGRLLDACCNYLESHLSLITKF